MLNLAQLSPSLHVLPPPSSRRFPRSRRIWVRLRMIGMYAIPCVTYPRMAIAAIALSAANVGATIRLIPARPAAPHPTDDWRTRRSERNAKAPQVGRRRQGVRSAPPRATSSTMHLCARPSLRIIRRHHRNAPHCSRANRDHVTVSLGQAHRNVISDAAIGANACRHGREPCRLVPADALAQPTLPLQLRIRIQLNKLSTTSLDLCDPPSHRFLGVGVAVASARCRILTLYVPTPS